MKLLAQLILLMACGWAVNAHALPCPIAQPGPDGKVSPQVQNNCNGPPRRTACADIITAGGVCIFDATGRVLPQTILPPAAAFIVPTFNTGNCDWGSTNSEVDANFARCMAYNFSTNPNLETVIQNMPPLVFARFSDEMRKYDASGYTQQMLNTAGGRLSGQSLAKLAASFGPVPMAGALAYASPAVRAVYNSISIVPNLGSAYWESTTGLTQTWPSKGADSPMHLFLETYTAGPGVAEATTAGTVPPVTAAFNKAWRYASTHMNQTVLPGNPFPGAEFPWVDVAKGVGDLLDIVYKNYLYNYNHNLPPVSSEVAVCTVGVGCLYVNQASINSSGINVVFAPPPIINVPPQPFVPNPPPYLQYVDTGAAYTTPCMLLGAAWEC